MPGVPSRRQDVPWGKREPFLPGLLSVHREDVSSRLIGRVGSRASLNHPRLEEAGDADDLRQVIWDGVAAVQPAAVPT